MHIGVIGNGAWSSAIQHTLSQNHKTKYITVWARNPQNNQETSDIKNIQTCDILFWCASTSALGHILLPPNIPVILACKGIQFENDKWFLPYERLKDRPVGVISGPNFASEIIQNKPSATVLASKSPEILSVAEFLKSNHFRIYLSNDIIGVQLGGALKNTIAIATGLCMGLDMGQNAMAGLLTRGLAEMKRIASLWPTEPDTLNGLSGLGDLILTATSLNSRNTRFGLNLARGASVEEAIAQSTGVIEGVRTIEAVYPMIQKHSMHLPIIDCLYRIIFNGASIPASIDLLLSSQANMWE